MKSKRTMLLVANISFAFMIAISALSAPGVKAICNYCWEIVPSANIGEYANELYGVAALADNQIVAVGRYIDDPVDPKARPLIERWNGTSWSIIPSPSNEPRSSLEAVSRVPIAEADSPNLWAVGYRAATAVIDNQPPYRNVPGAKTLVMRSTNTGQNWSVVPSPNPGSDSNVLTAVAGTSSSDVWVIGHSRDINGSYQTLALHWNGAGWTRYATPNPGQDNYLTSISAIPDPDTNSINYWAVGYHGGTYPEQNIILRWNGTQWVQVISPQPGTTNALLGVTAVSSDEAWAVGEYEDPGAFSGIRALTLHWQNGQWRQEHAQNPGNNRNWLYGVASIAPNFVLAVGMWKDTGTPFRTLTERWDGSQWVLVSSPNQGTRANELRGITVVPGTSIATGGNVWAVGTHAEYEIPRTLIMRYHIPSPTAP